MIKTISLSLLLLPIILQGSNSTLPHWSYDCKESGPAQWGDLHPAYHLAKMGKKQSPIDIAPAQASKEKLPEIDFNYKPCPLSIVNNGHTIQVNYEAGSFMTVGDESYDLLQFHFHSPSEHTYNGNSLAMEVHLVHKNKKDELAVVGVFLMEGKENQIIKELWNHAARKKGGAIKYDKVIIDANDFLPNGNKDYFAYSGSLTTPPCTEGVKWHVMKVAKQVSKTQVKSFLKTIGPNARPVQPLNTRVVKFSE